MSKPGTVLTTRRRCFFELVPPIPFPFCVQEREIDQLVVADVCALKLPGVTPEKVAMAVQRRSKRADIRVAYELLLDSKKARHRKEGDVCLSVRGRWPIQHNTCLQCLCDRFTAWQRRPDVIGLNRTRPGQCRRDCRKRTHLFFLDAVVVFFVKPRNFCVTCLDVAVTAAYRHLPPLGGSIPVRQRLFLSCPRLLVLLVECCLCAWQQQRERVRPRLPRTAVAARNERVVCRPSSEPRRRAGCLTSTSERSEDLSAIRK